MRERLELLIKRHETDMRLQHGNQLLVHTPQTLGLCARLVELPKQDRISQQKHQYDGEKTECQARADIETVQLKVALANLFRPSGKFHDRHTLLPIACLKRQEADPQSKPAETIAIHGLKEFYHRAVNLASTVVRASNQLFEPILSLLCRRHWRALFACQHRMQRPDIRSRDFLVFPSDHDRRTRHHTASPFPRFCEL